MPIRFPDKNLHILYKEFITDSQTKKNIELTEKICSLSEDKKVFITSVIDLLNDM